MFDSLVLCAPDPDAPALSRHARDGRATTGIAA
jgi:hypothetical protein